MRKAIAFFIVIVCCVNSYAQNVAINNDASLPDNSAILDIKSGTKGLLIPRMNTAGIAAIVNPAKGLLVLDTAKNQLLVNMGTPSVPNWQTIVAASGWGLTGNNGIDSATNFIGTTNTKPFIIRVNNVRSGYLDTITSNTSFGFRALDSNTTGRSNTAIGFKSLSRNMTGYSNLAIGNASLYNNQVGFFNIAIGVAALYNNTHRPRLVAIGDSALFNNVHGEYNTAIGSKALFSNFSGLGNTGAGFEALFANTTGHSNSAFGNRALFRNTTGIYNVGIGEGALFENTTGSYNSAVGLSSMFNNESGNNNVAMGILSLANNRGGYSNVAIGTHALANANYRSNLVAIGDSALYFNGNGGLFAMEGSGHTAVGSKALFSNTVGFRNTAIGMNTLYSNIDGYGNTGVGFDALFANTSGYSNSAFGLRAMFRNTTGIYNVGAGDGSLFENTTGSNNSSLGLSSMFNNVSGNNNTAIGFFSLVNNRGGHSNVAIGTHALANANYRSNLVAIGDSALYFNGNGGLFTIEGSGHTAVGSKALFSNTTGYNNTALGMKALYSNNTGYENHAIGTEALFSNTAGVQNIAIGSRSLWSNTLGEMNVAAGTRSLRNNTTGHSNVAYGVGSLEANSMSIGNSAFGHLSLGTSMGAYNTGLGYYTNVTTAILSNATAIGSFAAVGCNNCLVLGSVNGVNGGTSNVNVGIGTTTPVAPLTFGNNLGKKIVLWDSGPANQYGIGVESGLLQIHSDAPSADILFGYGSTGASFVERMRIKGNGKVGIGTTTPFEQFEVIGQAVDSPVTLVIGNRIGFGSAALEFVSDYGVPNQWRPGYIKSHDGGVGGFTGSLEFYTNGSGAANKYGSVKGFEVKNGVAYTLTGTVSAFSDARLKNHITAFTDGLNVIRKINPVQFYYNADAPFTSDHQQVGVIAQELEKLAPYMVEKNKQNGYNDLRSVNNQAYTFLLINAIKEQQLQIESQQSKINRQETDLEKLQSQVNELKKLVEQLLTNK